jgi:hypothetical protein
MSDTHFLSKLVAAAPASFAALAASLQHFVAALFNAAPFRFFGPIVLWQVAAAVSAGPAAAAAGAAGAGAAMGAIGAAGAGAGVVCAIAALTIQKEATIIAIVFMLISIGCWLPGQ